MIVWLLNLQLPMQSVTITTNVVRSNSAHGKVHSIQHYVEKKFSDLRQFRCFLWVLRFPPPIKLTAVQSVPITTNVVSLNHVHGEVYWIQHYVIKFVSYFTTGRQFSLGTPVSSTNETNLTATI